MTKKKTETDAKKAAPVKKTAAKKTAAKKAPAKKAPAKRKKKESDDTEFICNKMEESRKKGKSFGASFLEAIFGWCEKEESKYF